MILRLPLSVAIPRKKKEDRIFILNLNHYRNTHHMTLNKAKELYGEIVRFNLPIGCQPWLEFPPYRCTYTVYPQNNRKFDLGNVCSIIQKFTEDALVELQVIPDDNHKIIKKVTYKIGEVDKVNPRCELEIVAIGE